MSKEDVVRYVMETPYNANEAVLRSLLEDIKGGESSGATFEDFLKGSLSGQIVIPGITKLPGVLFNFLPLFDGQEEDTDAELIFPDVTEIGGARSGNAAGYTFVHFAGKVRLPKLVTITGTGNFQGVHFDDDVDWPYLTGAGSWAFNGAYYKRMRCPLLTAITAKTFGAGKGAEAVFLGAVTRIGIQAFNGSPITALVLYGPTRATLESLDAFTDCPIADAEAEAYVYVPRDLVEDYKTANNWTALADKIRAIEDYPEITTW